LHWPAPSLAQAAVVVVAPDAPQLAPDYWIGRLADADAVRLSPHAIAAQNARMAALDPHIESLAALPAHVPGADVTASLSDLSSAHAPHVVRRARARCSMPPRSTPSSPMPHSMPCRPR
jgi:hypothetical protein